MATVETREKESVIPKKASALIKGLVDEGRTSLLEYESEQVAKEYGIPVVKGGLASTEKQALLLAKGIGFPVVMKIVSPDILHKTDVGGVKASINSNAEVMAAFAEIMKKAKKSADIKGVYVQEMAPNGREFVVGATRDPQFGPIVMFGLGGIHVELYKDVSFRLAPVSTEEAISMIKEVKVAPLLTGFRGSKPLDINAGAEVIKAVGTMMTDFEEIESIDINPLFIYEKRCKAVDVRIVLKKPTQEEGAPTQANATK